MSTPKDIGKQFEAEVVKDEDNQEWHELREQLRRANEKLKKTKVNSEAVAEAALNGAFAAVSTVGRPKIKPHKSGTSKGKGRDEVALWHMTDWQGAKLTESYDHNVMKERAHRFVDKALKITEIQRADHPVKEAHIMLGGDMIEGLFNFPCVDTQTEALTPDGWRKVDDLESREIMAYDPEDGSLRYEKPSEIFQKHYTGTMYHYEGSKVDHLVTPHHRMYMKSRKEYPYQVKRANEYGSGANWYATSGEWGAGQWLPPTVRQNKYGEDWDWTCSSEDLAALIGWFVTEGYARSGEVFIAQSRTANPEKWQDIDLLLKRVTATMPRMRADGGVGYSSNEHGFHISSTSLSLWMQQFKPGLADTACLPAWVRNAPAADLRVLLDAMIRGDGHYQPSGTAQYVTTSSQLADDVQEIAMKLGYSTHIGMRDPRPNETIQGGLTQYVITLSGQERTAKRTAEVDYDDTVWCPKVSTGLWLARRNGKVIVTGNTQPYEISMTLFEQFVVVASLLDEVMRRACQAYDQVIVHPEWGNHGRLGSKRAAVPRSDNADRMTYRLAAEMGGDVPNLTWYECPDDVQRVEIGNYRALLIHGDEVGRNGFASPTTLVRHADQWASGAYPWDFRDLYIGHYHTHNAWAMANGRGHVFQTGSMESDNRYARNSMGSTAVPSQRLHFVDARDGLITAQYQIYLDA